MEYFKVDDLKEIFSILLLGGKHHKVKDTPIVPLKFKSEPIFVGNLRSESTNAVEVCNICNPPQVITIDRMGDTERHRAINNHMVLHYIQQPEIIKGNKRCAYCLGSCHAILSITYAVKNKIRRGEDIPPNAIVRPNCQRYSISPFTFKELKNIKKRYTSSNTLV